MPRFVVLIAALAMLLLPSPMDAAVAVTDCGDSGGPGQLRQVVAAAAPGETVTVPACMIVLSAGEVVITKGLSIRGVSASATVLDGNATSRIFNVMPSNTAVVSLSRMTLRNGKATAGAGGALVDQRNTGGSLVLTDVLITANDATTGGGLVVGGSNPADLTLTNVVVTRNRAIGGSAGGVAFGGDATLTNVTITDNLASIDGGGVQMGAHGISLQWGTLTIENSTISVNRAGRHGGGLSIYPDGAQPHQLCQPQAALTNVTISGNTAGTINAAGKGGGLTISSALLTNVTITGNSAPAGNGGGIASPASCLGTLLLNTIVANSTSGGNCLGTTPTDGNNISSDNTCSFAAPDDLINTDPLLGALADNGGPTATHALLAGSPAIDAGDDLRCPESDQRGAPRPQGAGCDVGAYEVGVLMDPIFANGFEPGA